MPDETAAARAAQIREGIHALDVIIKTPVPTVTFSIDSIKLDPVTDWIRMVLVPNLRIAALIGDASPLLGDDAAQAQELRNRISAVMDWIAPLQTWGVQICDGTVHALNASSVARPPLDPNNPNTRHPEPTLPSVAEIGAWAAQVRVLRELSSKTGFDFLQNPAVVCQDAALAMLQGRGLLNARATWRSGAAVSLPPAEAAKKAGAARSRTEVDDIFADSAFGDQQYLRDDGTSHDWCGMFVVASLYRGAAIDREIRLAFAHVDPLRDFFTYNTMKTRFSSSFRTPAMLWADGQWANIREYHRSRGVDLERRWASNPMPTSNIRPGDVVLIDHQGNGRGAGGAIADHIAMVESFDANTGTLVTIEGNIRQGLRPDASCEIPRTPDGELMAQEAVTNSTTGIHLRDLSDIKQAELAQTPGQAYRTHGGTSVFGIGRPSLVDFEGHADPEARAYAADPIPPELSKTPPAELRPRRAREVAPGRPARSVIIEPGLSSDMYPESSYHKRVGP